ncbi:MurR/RpiR family transcriptional regulator [Roseomonas fluvialis]|uniref:RpiR family transcriptional regulator n=1 Tax=Roseomonas fluvialis TaxID=1750527 RepID=A0ABN6P1H3_9PROT|nr:MurR/RpiR family transcriptional regulator [Roseomonas fluvialis]BDG71598.1 RpiR family transcriptional regulator [Roseomonas fluvialis]
MSTLSPAARRVARFVVENRPLALALSAAELAERTGTSDATVVRTVQALGFAGLPDLKRELSAALAAPQANPAEAMRTTLAEAGEESRRAVDLAIDTQREAVEALATPEARATLRSAVAALHPARRILVFGLGPSAALARYLATLLARAGRTTRALDASGIALADQMLDLGPGDALLVLAYGRAYREVVALFGEARRMALPVVLVTDSLDRSLARHADVVVPARRGRTRRVALHGATLVALEAIALGLAAMDGERALASLDRLNDLRAAIAGGRHDVG